MRQGRRGGAHSALTLDYQDAFAPGHSTDDIGGRKGGEGSHTTPAHLWPPV